MACIVSLDLQLIIHLPAAKQKQLDLPSKETSSWLRGTRDGSDASSSASDRHLNRLVEVQRNHFFHAVLDHLRGKKVCFPLLVHGDLSEILQQNWTNGFGGMGHVDGPVVAHHLAHVRQSATVVQVEMTENRTKTLVYNFTDVFFITLNKVLQLDETQTTDLMITQSKKSVRRPFWVT